MRYFFHVRHGSDVLRDHEGEEFSSLEDVKQEAIAAARDILATEVLKSLTPNFLVEATDENGGTVLVVNASAKIY